MKKYFFDIVGQQRAKYDFHGRDFAQDQKAFQLAQLLALDVEVEGDDELCGGTVHVRNAAGHSLYSVPIREPELIAA